MLLTALPFYTKEIDMSMIGTKQIRVGMVIKFEGELWRVLEAIHGTPGNLGAFMQCKLRHITKGNQTQHKFRTAESVELIQLDMKPAEYLYQEGDQYNFMDTETYEQFALNNEILEGKAKFLTPNMVINIQSYEGMPLGIEMPKKIKMKVVECEPYLKTATATNSFKQGKLENGASVQLPGFILEGEMIEIDTDTGAYVGRVKD